jgi:hypothetical protein
MNTGSFAFCSVLPEDWFPTGTFVPQPLSASGGTSISVPIFCIKHFIPTGATSAGCCTFQDSLPRQGFQAGRVNSDTIPKIPRSDRLSERALSLSLETET